MFSAIRNTFKAYERLKKEQHIYALFQSGKAFSVFPVRFIYQLIPVTGESFSPVLTGFSVPKKKFKSSVNRHRVRRLLAEAWRLNKSSINEVMPNGQQLHLFLIYYGSTLPDFIQIQATVVKGIELLKKYLKPLETH